MLDDFSPVALRLLLGETQDCSCLIIRQKTTLNPETNLCKHFSAVVHLVGDDLVRAEASFIPKLVNSLDPLLYRDWTHLNIKSLNEFAVSLAAFFVLLSTIWTSLVTELGSLTLGNLRLFLNGVFFLLGHICRWLLYPLKLVCLGWRIFWASGIFFLFNHL